MFPNYDENIINDPLVWFEMPDMLGGEIPTIVKTVFIPHSNSSAEAFGTANQWLNNLIRPLRAVRQSHIHSVHSTDKILKLSTYLLWSVLNICAKLTVFEEATSVCHTRRFFMK
ncbi:hypothetical protein TNCV_2391871 [Trichonephila clavipes]|nr:hypothetical protein TNCV_2391871 [Trichonephila clavipes]